MTVSTTTRVIRYAGDDETTQFPYPFRILDDTDINVIVTADGVDTVKVLDTDFSVTGAGEETGGNIDMVEAPAAGNILTIYRDMETIQETDYESNSPFPAQTHETALDRLTMIAQEFEETITRTVTIPISDDTASMVLPHRDFRAEKYLYFDENGEPTATIGTAGDHGNLLGLSDDDHTQYHTDARGDARYYTEAELDAGQLDNRYYTEAEIATISGDIVSYVDNSVVSNETMTTISGDLVSQIVTDHGALDGKGDDDHTQYLLASGDRQLTGTWNFGSQTISGTGSVITGDHGAATAQSVVNVIYGTGSPPDASGYTEGTLFIKYVA